MEDRKFFEQKEDLCPMWDYDAVIVGGGAAGFFAAMRLGELLPDAKIVILEKTGKVLAKVQISGGGRCNVTHACFDNKELVKNYPRGHKELLGCFFRFNPSSTIEWFQQKGVELKIESDGRMFPITDNSQTIIDCFWDEIKRLDLEIQTHCEVKSISKSDTGFTIELKNGGNLHAKTVLIATGGHTKSYHFDYLASLGHQYSEPVPSLFTFNLPTHPITKLQGITVFDVSVSLPEFKKTFKGPILITHWGLSGPAVLKLSSFAAHELNQADYRYQVKVNWMPEMTYEAIQETLLQLKKSKKTLGNKPFSEIPQRLWELWLFQLNQKSESRWSEINNQIIKDLSELLNGQLFEASGKTTFKDEFVTSGGILRTEIDFRTMESKLHQGLFFAGEVIDIDAITGGFNFQAAWTTGWIAAENMRERIVSGEF